MEARYQLRHSPVTRDDSTGKTHSASTDGPPTNGGVRYVLALGLGWAALELGTVASQTLGLAPGTAKEEAA